MNIPSVNEELCTRRGVRADNCPGGAVQITAAGTAVIDMDECIRRGAWRRCVRYRKEKRGECHPDEMLPDGSVDDQLK